MADRYEDRYRREQNRGERGYERDDRNFVERAGDEVRSWFGDEEARRRRRVDEHERDRSPEQDRWRTGEPDRTSEYGWTSDRGWRDRDDRSRERSGDRWSSERSGTEYGRTAYDRARTSWVEPQYGYGPGLWSADIGNARSGGGASTFERSTSSYETSRPARSYVGRGPKGYQRSDARITEDVCDRLADAPDVDASDVEVTVKGGEVTLSGTVPDRQQKRRTEDLIEDISGVREVHNNLRTGRADAGYGTGTAVATSAMSTEKR